MPEQTLSEIAVTRTSDIGLIGLGTMGAALALNIADNDHRVSV